VIGILQIERVDVVGERRVQIHHVAHNQRRALVAAQHARRKLPGELHLADIVRRDLLQRRVTLVKVVARRRNPLLRVLRERRQFVRPGRGRRLRRLGDGRGRCGGRRGWRLGNGDRRAGRRLLEARRLGKLARNRVHGLDRRLDFRPRAQFLGVEQSVGGVADQFGFLDRLFDGGQPGRLGARLSRKAQGDDACRG